MIKTIQRAREGSKVSKPEASTCLDCRCEPFRRKHIFLWPGQFRYAYSNFFMATAISSWLQQFQHGYSNFGMHTATATSAATSARISACMSDLGMSTLSKRLFLVSGAAGRLALFDFISSSSIRLVLFPASPFLTYCPI